jgi:hypothetical protein
MPGKPIYVTEPFLPPLEEYVEYLKGIWDRNVLANQGPLVRELEQNIQAYHQIDMPTLCDKRWPWFANHAEGSGHQRRGDHHSVFLCGYVILPVLGRVQY